MPVTSYLAIQTRYKFSFAINNVKKYRLDYFTEYLFIFI